MALSISSNDAKIDFKVGDMLVRLDSNHDEFIVVLGFYMRKEKYISLRIFRNLGPERLKGPFDVVVSNCATRIFCCKNGSFLIQDGNPHCRKIAAEQNEKLSRELQPGDSISNKKQFLIFCGQTNEYQIFVTTSGDIVCQYKRTSIPLTLGSSCVLGRWYEDGSIGRSVDSEYAKYICSIVSQIGRDVTPFK